MLEVIVEETAIDRQLLLDEIQEVFQKHGTSEYAFVLNELPCLRSKFGANFDPRTTLTGAVDAFREGRRRATRLYDGVNESLATIKATGCILVGYTESLAFYSSQRVRKLGLDGVLDYLYSPPDHDIPANMTREDIRRYPADHYALQFTAHRYTPKGRLKPSPEVLARIVHDLGVPLSETVYVGDNLHKDVTMAQATGVFDVHAAYGESHNDEGYELLKRVTHWTPEAVQAQQDATHDNVQPTWILSESFSELLSHFEFARPLRRTESLTHAIELWKTAVDVQKHFNDIQLRLRHVMMTLLIALIGAAAFAIRDKNDIEILGHSTSAAVLILVAAFFGVVVFYFMDVGYHRLLLGAVKHGMSIEQQHGATLPGIRLAHAIKNESPVPMFGARVTMGSKVRLHLLHVVLMLVTLILALFAHLSVNPSASPENGAVISDQKSGIASDESAAASDTEATPANGTQAVLPPKANN